MTKRTWKIGVEWSVYGIVEIETDEGATAEEALQKAKDFEENDHVGFQLPTDSNYMDDSFTINNDAELVKGLNED
jgi:hypothetical protein